MDGKERAKRFLLARTGLNQNGEEGKMLVYQRTGVPSSALVAYEDPDSTRMLNIGYVERLANHYGVNAAWLLGQSESWSLERDLRQACELIGLSPDTVNALRELTENEEQRRFLDAFLSSNEFTRVVHMMAGMKHPDSTGGASCVDYAALLGRLDGEEDCGFCERDFADMRLWRACKELENVIDRFMK